MKLVILGGTFNPPHKGHIAMADLVRKTCGYDRVVFVPSFQPAHKSVSMGIRPEQRLAMAELAAAEIEYAFVSNCEIQRQGISYSLDTVRHLKEQYSPEGKPGLIIGDDLVPGFSGWHLADQLAQEADLIVLHRDGRDKLDFPFPHRYINNGILPFSSSEIRRKISRGISAADDLPASVWSYIQSQRLYRG